MNPNPEYATKQYVVETEARIATMIQQLAQVQLNTNDQLEKLTVTVGRLTSTVENLSTTVAQVAQSVSGLRAEFREMESHTDERLNALIAVVDDLVRKNPQQ